MPAKTQVVAALEKNTCVQDIAVSTGPAADAGAIAAWESVGCAPGARAARVRDVDEWRAEARVFIASRPRVAAGYEQRPHGVVEDRTLRYVRARRPRGRHAAIGAPVACVRAGQAVPLGRVHVNSLADMTPVPCNDFAEARGPFCVSPAEATAGVHVAGFAGRAFAVDRTPSGAHVALCYGDDASAAPQIWFRDTAFWHFIASTYADYFRLELAH